MSQHDDNLLHMDPTSQGIQFPADYVLAVIDDRAEAERAVAALHQAGVAQDDVVLYSGPQVVEHVREAKEQADNPIARLLTAMRDATEEGLDAQAYVRQAEAGHTVVNVHVPDDAQVDRVRDLLLAHQAHLIKYVSRWSITNLHA